MHLDHDHRQDDFVYMILKILTLPQYAFSLVEKSWDHSEFLDLSEYVDRLYPLVYDVTVYLFFIHLENYLSNFLVQVDHIYLQVSEQVVQ